jgi:hypothetical protein
MMLLQAALRRKRLEVLRMLKLRAACLEQGSRVASISIKGASALLQPPEVRCFVCRRLQSMECQATFAATQVALLCSRRGSYSQGRLCRRMQGLVQAE